MRKKLLLLAWALLSLAGCCSIHEYPEEPGVDPSLIDVRLSLAINMDLNDEDPIIQTYQTMLNTDFDIRYIVEIYKVADSYAETVGSLERRIEKVESTIIEDGIYEIDEQIRLHAGLYSVMVWVDFIRKGTDADYYYSTKNLHEVRINRFEGKYIGYHVTKDAFAAQKNMDLLPYAHDRFVEYRMEIPVERPFAVYQVVTTDIAKYRENNPNASYGSIRPSQTDAVYGLYFPMGYNVYYGVPDAFEAGVGYSFDVVETVEQEEAIVASDFVFVDTKDTFYYLNFSIKTPEGKLINTTRDLKVNLQKNRLTIVRGEFLTRDIDDGEIGIDPGFDEEIVVPIG